MPILDAIGQLLTRGEPDSDERRQLNELLVEIAPELASLSTDARTTSRIRTGFATEQDPENARQHFFDAVFETLRQASSTEAANAVNNLAVLATIRGDFDQAWGLYEEVLGLDGGQPGPQTVLTYQNMGMLRADQERWDEGRELCRETRSSLHEPLIELNRVEALAGSGDLVAAREACGRSLKGFRCLDDALGIADALRLYGRICRAEQNWDEGRDCLERSIALNREFGETVSLGETLYELGLLRRDAGERASAVEPLQEAEQIFNQIGAAPDLERVQEALAELETS